MWIEQRGKQIGPRIIHEFECNIPGLKIKDLNTPAEYAVTFTFGGTTYLRKEHQAQM